MPSCVIKSCKNNSKVNKKIEGISFHKFPKNTVIRERDEWVAAVRRSRNEPQWQPSSSSVVCSDHFDKTDMYDTNRGLRRIHSTGYPKKKLFPPFNVVISDKLSPGISSPFVPDLPTSSSVIIDSNCVALPSTSSATVLDFPVSPNVIVDSNCVVLPSTSSATVLDLPDKPRADDDEKSIFDTPRKHKMRKRLKKQEINLKKNVKKIKALQQKVRRLQNRNLSLKKIINNLKTQNLIDTDLITH